MINLIIIYYIAFFNNMERKSFLQYERSFNKMSSSTY